jgi:hypothetical protein
LRRVPLVQAIRTRRRWLARLRSPYAWRASSFASLFRLSEAAFVTPVITAQTIWSSQRLIVLARLDQLGDVVMPGAPQIEGEQPDTGKLARPVRRGRAEKDP